MVFKQQELFPKDEFPHMIESQTGVQVGSRVAEIPHTPESKTRIRVGNRFAQIPLSHKRREALAKLLPLLDQLEGKDIYIGSYFSSQNHFWASNLKLGKLKVEKHSSGDKLPSVIVLWGSRGASVRIFTDQIVAVREQQYSGYTQWLLDFWNGFGEHPIDPYRPIGYVSLHIVRFKDQG